MALSRYCPTGPEMKKAPMKDPVKGISKTLGEAAMKALSTPRGKKV